MYLFKYNLNLNRQIKKRGKVDILTLIVFICLFCVLFVYYDTWGIFDCWLQDFWQKTRILFNQPGIKNAFFSKLFPIKSVNDDIVVIGIDDESILSIPGLLNLDKNVFAKALRNLKDLNPKTIGLDILFEYSKTNDPNTYSSLKKQNITEIDPFIKVIDELKDKIVISAFRRDDKRMTTPASPFSNYNYGCTYFKNYRDNSIRSFSLYFKNSQSTIYPSFQTILWTKFKDINLREVNFQNNYLCLKNEKLAKLINNEYLLINYNKPFGRIVQDSFINLYNNKIPKDKIENKLIIIGFANSMTGIKHYTPTEGDKYSPFLNALALDNFLEKSFIKPSNKYITLSISAILLIILYFLFSYLSPPLSLLITFIIDILLLIFSCEILMQSNMQIDVICPILATTFAFIFIVGKKYYIESQEKKHIKSAFQHYVTASVVNEILKDPSKLNLHGEERNLTIFFSDIEGFTTLSEGMSPLDVVSLLNEYLTAMTDIIFEFNGLLDKYEGDAIMAVFGAPVDQSDHAIRACRCALKNQKVLNQLHEKWEKEGKPKMKVRIGINTGIVVVGNMGSTMRFDYTVIGDNVNLASRLESANKLFNSSILVSEETAKLAEKAIVSRKLAKLKAIGKSVYTNVYELLSDKLSDTSREIEAAIKSKEAYEESNECIINRDFEKAEKILGVYLKDNPNDIPAKILYNRVKGYLLVPPPVDWENIIVQEEK